MILSTEVRTDPDDVLLLLLSGLHPLVKDEDLYISYTGAGSHNGAYRVLSVTTSVTDHVVIRKVWVARQDERRIRR